MFINSKSRRVRHTRHGCHRNAARSRTRDCTGASFSVFVFRNAFLLWLGSQYGLDDAILGLVEVLWENRSASIDKSFFCRFTWNLMGNVTRFVSKSPISHGPKRIEIYTYRTT